MTQARQKLVLIQGKLVYLLRAFLVQMFLKKSLAHSYDYEVS